MNTVIRPGQSTAPVPALASQGDKHGRFAVIASILSNHCDLKNARLLDFGCGAGNLVRAALARGIDAYGCDIDFSHKWRTEAELMDLLSSRRVRQIAGANANESPETGEPYRLPFEDGEFDVLVSDNVLEHVRNYPEMIAEFRRVVKPGGIMLHLFPSLLRPVEAHVYVPLASFFWPYWWLRLWAALGIRTRFQKELTPAQVARFNHEWLPRHTNYMTIRQLRRLFEPAFTLRFVEHEFMRVSRAKVLLFPWIYRTFFSRVMLGTRAR